MTVADLIAELQKYPNDMRVVIPGYEYGVDDAAPVQKVNAQLDANVDPNSNSGKKEWFAGRHALEDRADGELCEVVLIGENSSR